MTHRTLATIVLVGLAGLTACTGGSETAPVDDGRATVRIPLGDAERGRVTFEELRCWTCHGVAGEDFPDPVTTTPTGVTLGSAWDHAWSPDELADAILNPSHEISEAYADGVVQSGKLSRMGRYSHIEVQHLSDLVAFLREVSLREAAGD